MLLGHVIERGGGWAAAHLAVDAPPLGAELLGEGAQRALRPLVLTLVDFVRLFQRPLAVGHWRAGGEGEGLQDGAEDDLGAGRRVERRSRKRTARRAAGEPS